MQADAEHPPAAPAPARAAQGRAPILPRILPFLSWFAGYRFSHLRADLISGLTVALVLIPQSMAYAQLAGLPAHYGLYAAFLPPMVAALFGSSHQLATGPVAVVSLMTAAALEPLAAAGSDAFVAYAILLSLLVGAFQFLLGLFRLGLVVNFLSHPVVNGFTNAAALIIASSQLAKLFGVDVEKAEHHYETVIRTVRAAVEYTHWPTLGLAALAIGIMVAARRINRRIPGVLVAVVVCTLLSWATGFDQKERVPLARIQAPAVLADLQAHEALQRSLLGLATQKVALAEALRQVEAKDGAASVQAAEARHRLSLVTLSIASAKRRAAELRVKLRRARLEKTDAGFVAATGGDGHLWRLKVREGPLDPRGITLTAGGAVVGTIPSGLPALRLPSEGVNLALIPSLLPVAIIISLLGFMEAISIAKAMAAKTGQRLDPNQELVGQGLANLVGSFFRSYPVSGSFSRSAVNLQTGAATGLSSLCSTAVVLVALLFLTPALYHLPQSVLASIIMMAVVGLLNVSGFLHAWHAQRYDGAISVITFGATLAFAPHLDRGIMVGVVLSVGLYLLRNMRPGMARLAKHPDGSYRSTEHWNLEQCPHIAVIRFSESLFFINVSYLEQKILDCVSSMPELRHILLVGNGINELDASGEEMLSLMVTRVREAGFDFSVSGLNDAVLDVMRRTRLHETIGEDHIFRNVQTAVAVLYPETHRGSSERHCPLLEAPLRGIPAAPTTRLRDEIAAGPPAEKP